MISKKLEQLRQRKGMSQVEVAKYMTENGLPITQASISKWEKGQTLPNAEQFLMLCGLYAVRDVLATFECETDESDDELNDLGRKRLQEYAELLANDERFAKPKPKKKYRTIPFYDIPVSAGRGQYVDGESAEQIEVGDDVPETVDFALRISGDSMMPKFENGQTVYVHAQNTIDDGEVGIYLLNGDVFCKVLDIGKTVRLLSLNPKYKPISLTETDEFRVLGKVVM